VPTEYYDNFENPVYTFANLASQRGAWAIKMVNPSEATVEPFRLYSSDITGDNVIIHPQIWRTAAAGYWGFSTIRPFDSQSNGHLIFAYKGLDDFWYAGFSVKTTGHPTGLLYVGHKTGDLGSTLDNWPLGLEYGYQFDAAGDPDADAAPALFPGSLLGIDVRTEVTVQPVTEGLSLVEVKWFWNRSGQGVPNPATPFNTVSFVTGFNMSGQLGMGATAYETHFDNFGIFDLP
jgi:hypothetical protein